jgi:tryptophan 7-halogenase
MTPIRNIVILGAGSAGLFAALALRRRFPALPVKVIRSSELGVIGVGEGTTQQFPRVAFGALGIDVARFYAETQPQWKLGLKFLWGPRPYFFYSFSNALDFRAPGLSRNNGFFAEDAEPTDIWTALMEEGRVVPSATTGEPVFFGHQHLGFHIENVKLVAFLEGQCRALGVEFQDATVANVETREHAGERQVAALLLADGGRIEADLFVDASGFRGELLSRALAEPFISYADALFCDRAIIGGWERTAEPILPYTTCETMDAGWCWQIEHEHFINRGYVYSAADIGDDEARMEFLRKNPGVQPDLTRVVKFRSGRTARMWAGNVVAIGNASGFVEPLEATSLGVILGQALTLADCLEDAQLRPARTIREVYNKFVCATWDDIRDFLAIHYRFNTRLDTPFWHRCRESTPLGRASEIVAFYEENGPSALAKTILLDATNHPIGWEGFLALLVGQNVPHARPHTPSAEEHAAWRHRVAECRSVAAQGFAPEDLNARIRREDWRWDRAN